MFCNGERHALASIGVSLPSLGDEIRAAAMRARRPLHQARETLILVSPHHDETGEPRPPHPLWDELQGRLREPRDRRYLLFDAPMLAKPIARTTVAVTNVERPPRVHHASISIPSRPVESPGSLTKLIGCSFCHALDYVGHIRPHPSPRLAVESRLHGLIAHEVLARLARRGFFPATPELDVRQFVLDVLDPFLRTHASLLLLHGHQQELVFLRDAVGGAVDLLVRLMRAQGLRVFAAEEELRANVGGTVLRGTPDLVLEDSENRLVLLDFKWSGEAYRREELRGGTSLQLAAYATLLGRRGLVVRSLGYLILRSQRLLLRGDGLELGERIHPDLLDETWIAAERAWTERAAELARGEVHAGGVAPEGQGHTPQREAVLERGRLLLPAPCTYCRLDLLCGREKRAS